MPSDDPIILDQPKQAQRISPPSRQYALIREGHCDIHGASVVFANTLDEALDFAEQLFEKTGHGWRVYAPLP